MSDMKLNIENHELLSLGFTCPFSLLCEVDWCEFNQEQALRANVLGTMNVSDLCSEMGIHCTLYATVISAPKANNGVAVRCGVLSLATTAGCVFE